MSSSYSSSLSESYTDYEGFESAGSELSTGYSLTTPSSSDEASSLSSSSQNSSSFGYDYDSSSSGGARETDLLKKKGHRATNDVFQSKKTRDVAATEYVFPDVKDSVTLQWKNVTYDVIDIADKKNKSKKRILHGLGGHCAPGTLTAIIGPSGAGKTSLLRFLARKNPASELTSGEITANGRVMTPQEWSRTTAFVAQDDVLMGSLTVRETFRFAAHLKLKADATVEERERVTGKIIEDLGLTQCQDTFNGYTGAAAANSGMKRGISGGERKRVSIGLELLTEPKLLFLDEPTSGLDSYAAQNVMVHLKKLAKSGRTIVATIHQPSAQVFSLFDNLIILAEGKTLYNGPAHDALGYFASHGYKCPPHRNPADYYIKILFLGNSGDDVEAGKQQLENTDPKQVSVLAEMYDKSEMKAREDKPPVPPGGYPPPMAQADIYSASWMRQMTAIFGRSLKNTSREPLLFKARIGQAFGLGLIGGLIYLRMGRSEQSDINDRAGALFFMSVMTAFSSMNGPMLVFPSERAVYYRENASGLYQTSAYFVGKILSEMPVQMIVPAVFSAIIYWMCNLRATADAFFIFMLVQFVMTQVPYAMAMVIVCAIKNQAAALQFQPVVMLPFMLLSGYYLNTDDIPIYFRWLEYLSFIKYGFRALIKNEFAPSAKFGCSQSDLEAFNNKCPIVSGDQFVEFLGMSNGDIFKDIATMSGMFFGYLIIVYLLLRTARKE